MVVSLLFFEAVQESMAPERRVHENKPSPAGLPSVMQRRLGVSVNLETVFLILRAGKREVS